MMLNVMFRNVFNKFGFSKIKQCLDEYLKSIKYRTIVLFCMFILYFILFVEDNLNYIKYLK